MSRQCEHPLSRGDLAVAWGDVLARRFRQRMSAGHVAQNTPMESAPKPLFPMPQLRRPPIQMVLLAIVLQARINARQREIRLSRPPSLSPLNGNEDDEI